MQQNRRNFRLQDHVDMLLLQDGVAIEDHLVAFDGYNFSGIFIHEVFDPALQDTRRQFAADCALEACL